MGTFTPAKTGSSRVFIIEGRARPDHEPDFQACMVADAPEQAFGDVESIRIPDPARYNQSIELSRSIAPEERATMDLIGRLPLEIKSTLLKLARRRCFNDVQIHMGKCTDPRVFNEFEKSVVLEDVFISNYAGDSLGNIDGEDNSVNETATLSAKNLYELTRLSFAEAAGDSVTNPLNDVVILSEINCGDCNDEDNGCDKIYAVGESTPGSPGTPPDIVYSVDGGVNWYSADINTIAVGDGADGVAGLGEYVVVVSTDEGALHYIDKDDLDTTPPGAGFSQVTTGFVASNNPIDIWSVGNYAFIVGQNGYVYGSSDPTAGVTVLDAGVATTNGLNAVHALSDKFAVAVGDSGTIIKTENQSTWASVTGPSGVADAFTAVWVKNENEWWIGSDAGEVYYTLNGGVTWTQKTLPGTAPSDIDDIAFASDSVMYISGVVSSNGRIYRSYNGGNSFVILPEGAATMPAGDSFAAIAACKNDADFVVGVGTGDDASDGILVLGQGQ